MRFTVILDREVEQGSSYNLTFEPGLVWSKGDEWIVDTHFNDAFPDNSYFKVLLEKEEIKDAKGVVIVVHPNGNAGEGDLNRLIQDVEDVNLPYQIVRF